MDRLKHFLRRYVPLGRRALDPLSQRLKELEQRVEDQDGLIQQLSIEHKASAMLSEIQQRLEAQENLASQLSQESESTVQLRALEQRFKAWENLTNQLAKESESSILLKELEQRFKTQEKLTQQLSHESEASVRLALCEDAWLRDHKDLHRGQRCFLLGCGPSLKAVDLNRLRGETVMGVNGTYMIDELELTYFASVSHIFWKHHTKGLREHRCARRFLPWYLSELASDCPTSWITLVDRAAYQRLNMTHPWSFSTDPARFVYGGGTVIYVCLQILYHLGFEQVILLGLDHDYGVDPATIRPEGESVSSESLQAHFCDNYYQPGDHIHLDIHTMERAYQIADDIYAADGRRIVNASPGTKLDVFEQVDFMDVFASQR